MIFIDLRIHNTTIIINKKINMHNKLKYGYSLKTMVLQFWCYYNIIYLHMLYAYKY